LLKKPEKDIAAIILAAGGSARFGSPKQLLTQHGENLVHRAARIAIEAGIGHVIVVLGAYATSIESFLADMPHITIANNRSWEKGQSTSLHTGIRSARKSKSDGALIMLADQPLIEASSIQKLLDRFDDKHRLVASQYNGVLGAPAIFGAEFFDKLLELTGDHGAGAWLRNNAEAVTTVRMAEAAIDIDTPDDLQHFRHD
jgi:CTP:molybdopterin cytidylyltransferase MocA